MTEILKVAQKGEAVLALHAAEVSMQEFGSTWLNALADAMHATMLARNGVGIAAPQVYVSRRVIIVASRPNIRYPDAPEMDAIVMINPEIIESDGEQTGDEGCLSVPGKAGQVTRPNHVKARFMGEDMNEYEIEGEELLARGICHELDHLDGHLYVEKVEGALHDVTYEDTQE